MTQPWRLLDTSPRTAAENMALDEVILTACSQSAVPNTLRFLQFTPPCTLIGYHQSVEQEIRLSYCQEHGIQINRRLTGGGGLFWDENQLGWEVIAQQDDRFPAGVESLYELLCQGTIRGLARLGVEASFVFDNDQALFSQERYGVACINKLLGADIPSCQHCCVCGQRLLITKFLFEGEQGFMFGEVILAIHYVKQCHLRLLTVR